jgi:Fanconi anemia group M protein
MRPSKPRRPSGGYRSKGSQDSATISLPNGEGPKRRDWFPSAGEMVTLVADAAQKGNAILTALGDKKVRLVYANLQVGDFQITDNVYVSYMTTESFVRSLADKRLYRQVLEIKRAVPEPVLLVEGPSVYEVEGANAYLINGALAFISVLNRIPVIFAEGPEESADLLFMATNQMQFGLGYEVHAEDQKARKREFKEIQQDVLAALPGIGPNASKALLRQHGSLRQIFSLTPPDLAEAGLDEGSIAILAQLFDYKG